MLFISMYRFTSYPAKSNAGKYVTYR